MGLALVVHILVEQLAGPLVAPVPGTREELLAGIPAGRAAGIPVARAAGIPAAPGEEILVVVTVRIMR